MRLPRYFGLTVFAAAAVTLAAADARPDDKAGPKKQLKQKAAAKKAEEARKAEEAKKAADAAAAKKSSPDAKSSPPAEPLKPAAIGAGKDAPAVAAVINDAVAKALAANTITPSPTCPDADFVRRVYLDLAGVIPPADKVKAFLDNADPAKRAKLIDELLASPAFGRHQADVWMGLLVQRSSDNRRVSFDSLRTWLADEFNANPGWDKTVAGLVTATGEQEKSPAVGFFLSNNTVDKMTDEVTKVFLGVQLQCAQCHNHPFTGWKQTEYWGMAQFFMKVEVGGLGKDAKPAVREADKPRRNKMNPLPESAKFVPAKYLQGEEPKLDKTGPVRPALAKWLTAPTNPFFARAMVNRVWAQLLGRGFVNPIDDMHEGKEPSHPDLLHALAADFAASRFDLKHLFRSVCLSEAYQRSSKPAAGNESDETYFSHAPVRVMTPEQLFDSLAAVTGPVVEGRGPRDKNVKGPQPGARDRFVQFYLAGAEQPNAVEYEAGIPQALKLMNSRLAGNPQAARAFVASGAKPAQVAEKMYLATLSRRPTAEELKRVTDYAAKTGNPAEAATDLLWALVNCSEFTLVR